MKDINSSPGGGKVPPQAKDIEDKILGAIMIDSKILDDVSSRLKPEMFYNEGNKLIYQAITDLSEAAKPIDMTTVMAELQRAGTLDMVGGIVHLMSLTDSIVGYGNEEYYATIIAEKHLKRETILAAHKTIEACYSDQEDIFDIISESDGHKDAMMDSLSSNSEVSSESLFEQAIEDMNNKVEGMTGVPSGIQGIDIALGGFQPTSFYVLAARPGMGKTACALSMAYNSASIHNKKVGFFSLEMSNVQLMNRIISNAAEIEQNKIRKGIKYLADYELHQIHGAKSKIKNIYWDDTPSISIQQLRAKAKRMKRRYGIEILYVDYLQLMNVAGFKGNTEAEVSKISRGLKLIAKELDIPVIALSQLSRAVESRPGSGKRPMLSDLRSSGSIEQDADGVMFIYRPEYYGNTENENGESTLGEAEFIIAKNRHGETRTVNLRFIGKFARFTDSVDSMMNAGREMEMQSNFDFDSSIKVQSSEFDDDPF